MPKNPSSPIRRSTSRGTLPCSSHALANGLTSVSTKRRTWRRNSSCSSRKYGEGRDSGAAVTVRFMGSAESFPGERGAATERRQFGERGLAVHGRHAAVGAGKNPFGGHVANRLLDRRDDLLGRLDLIAGNVDHAEQHVLAVEQAQQADRHSGIPAFDRDLLDVACGECRKDRLVLAPFAAERRLPFEVRRNAVTVADVHGR